MSRPDHHTRTVEAAAIEAARHETETAPELEWSEPISAAQMRAFDDLPDNDPWKVGLAAAAERAKHGGAR